MKSTRTQTSHPNSTSDQPEMSSLIRRMMWPSYSSTDDPTPAADTDGNPQLTLPLGMSCRQNLSRFTASRCESTASSFARKRVNAKMRRGAIGPADREAQACSKVHTKFKIISNLQQYAKS